MRTQHSSPTLLPEQVTKETLPDSPTDTAEQADRLTMIMETEGIASTYFREPTGEPLEEYSYPLDDTQEIMIIEESDEEEYDPTHELDRCRERLRPAEEAAMHVVDGYGVEVES